MKEYIYNEAGDYRVILETDQNAKNPRLAKDNLCILETWDIVSPSPDYAQVRSLQASLIHTLSNSSGEWRSCWTDKKGVEHTRHDEYTCILLMRTLRAFGESQYVTLLTKNAKGSIMIADQWEDENIIGIGYVMPLSGRVYEEELRDFMQEEIDAFNQWARGDVWKYTIEKRWECQCGGTHPGCDGSDWIKQSTQTGIYGKELAIATAATEWSEMEIPA